MAANQSINLISQSRLKNLQYCSGNIFHYVKVQVTSRYIMVRFHTLTSGHDYLEGERRSCLMNTHWNTVSSNRLCQFHFHFKFHVFHVWGSNPSQGHSMFPRLGFESQSRQLHVSRSGVRIPVKIFFFAFFPSPNFLQRPINGQYFSE